MDKNKIKLIIMLIPLLLGLTALSGCVGANAIQTWGWDHINTEGTGVRLWGHLTLAENFHEWDGYFVYDVEKHDNWENYDYLLEADNYDSLNYFSVDLYGLNRTTEYHYRAVGEKTTQNNVIRVGADAVFIPGGPRVKIYNVSDIGIDSATLEGELTHMGGAPTCEVFFRYGEESDNLNQETPHEIMTSTGQFSAEITGLDSCTTYYYRAYASNDADTWRSVWIFEVTPGMPQVETYLPNDVTQNSATFRGELFHLAGTASCEVWFEYGDDNPNNLDETTDPILMNVTGQFEIPVDNLNTATTYWVRAVADNGVCQNKGEIKEFKTGGGSINTKITQDFKSIIKTKIITYICNRYDLNEQGFNLLVKEYPIIDKILQKLS